MADGSSRDDFDWVTATAGCSAALMFQQLLDGTRADVERRKGATFGRTDHWQFEFHADEESFEVVRVAGSSKDGAVVTFALEGPRITISGDGVDVQMTAVVGINPHGDCRYYIGEGEFLAWEVRKQALDQLFFEDIEE
ncbi:MAG TPA: hypothetical protein VM096_01320 [Vicinamibacterales bacterium]|nr:hypothetical protein [Vicinamibacterales bacterium]